MTKIEWTNETWNPVIGCSKISPGCQNCYAERMANRLSGIALKTCIDTDGNFDMSGIGNYADVITPKGKWNGKTRLIESALQKPFHWKKPRMIFVCSMGDLFHESVSFYWIDIVFTVIASNPQHTFQILTKRPERMLEWFNYKDTSWKNEGMQGPERIRYACWHRFGKIVEYEGFWPLKNLWLGVTVESPEYLWRIEKLSQIPAAVRFVSVEPMLSRVLFLRQTGNEEITDYLKGEIQVTHQAIPILPQKINKIDWVIAGPETGPGARAYNSTWFGSLYSQCKAAGVPFFDKKDMLGLGIKEFPRVLQRLTI